MTAPPQRVNDMPSDIISKLKDELGLSSLLSASRDVHLILLTRTLRMFAYGSSTLILALFISSLGNSDSAIGLFMSLTLVGDVLISLCLTFVADQLGRRRILLIGSLSMTFSGVVFASTNRYMFLLFAAVVGVISPSGNEIGPFRAVEESTLAHLVPSTVRSDIFAWYVVVGTLGTSVGTLSAGWFISSLETQGENNVSAFRFVFWAYALLGLVKASITLLLSDRCEAEAKPRSEIPTGIEEAETFLAQPDAAPAAPPPSRKWAFSTISPESRKTLLKLSAIFSIDSLASGMVSISLISYFLSTKFDSSPASLGTILSAAAFMSSVGNILASSISKRIGFINTMVFTHLPSAVFLALFPAPHSLTLTIVFLVLRATLASMDQAPRSAFLSAIVQPNERTAVMGTLDAVKTASQSVGPLITGFLAANNRFGWAFVAAGIMKGSYDLGLLTMFSETKLRGNADAQRERARQDEGEEVEL